jgi:hypothetical protein
VEYNPIWPPFHHEPHVHGRNHIPIQKAWQPILYTQKTTTSHSERLSTAHTNENRDETVIPKHRESNELLDEWHPPPKPTLWIPGKQHAGCCSDHRDIIAEAELTQTPTWILSFDFTEVSTKSLTTTCALCWRPIVLVDCSRNACASCTRTRRHLCK